MMTDEQLDMLRDSFKQLAARSDELGDRFYARLFAIQPMLRAVMPRDAWQRDRDLTSGLGMLVKNLHRLDAIAFILEDTGARFSRAGAEPQHFGKARDELVGVVRDMLGDAWNSELESAWTEALNATVSLMLRGAGRARLRAA